MKEHEAQPGLCSESWRIFFDRLLDLPPCEHFDLRGREGVFHDLEARAQARSRSGLGFRVQGLGFRV